MNRPVIQITRAQIESAVTQMRRKWRSRNIVCARSQARDLYVRDLVELVDVILDKTIEHGFLEDPLEDGLRVAESALLKKWLAPARRGQHAFIRITDAQVNRSVNKVYRKWCSSSSHCGFRFTRPQIKHLLLSSLVMALEKALTRPDRNGTVSDLAKYDPRPINPELLAKYAVA